MRCPQSHRQGRAAMLGRAGTATRLSDALQWLFPRVKLCAGAPCQPRSINSWEKGRDRKRRILGRARGRAGFSLAKSQSRGGR